VSASTATRRGRALRAAPRTIALLVAVLALPFHAASVLPAAAYDPSVNYALHCQGCHLVDGKATPGLVPPLDGALGRFMRVGEGRDYLLRLPSVVAVQLDDADTAALLTWVVRRFGAGEVPVDFAPFTAAEVATSRDSGALVDVHGARRHVLEVLGEGPG